MEARKFNWRRYSAPVAIASMILAALSVVLYFNIREYLAVRDGVRFDVSLFPKIPWRHVAQEY